jgi:predicted aspartyl protease
VVPVRIGAPGSGACVAIEGRIDTGSDFTVVPFGLTGELDLPLVRFVRVHGVDAVFLRVPVWAAEVEIEGHTRVCEVLALGAEMLLGRNVLETLVLRLDGRRRAVDVAAT